MNVLLIGPADSIFTKDFCMKILDDTSMNVTILTQRRAVRYQHDYADNGITVIEWPKFFQKGLSKQLFHFSQIKKEWDELSGVICGQGEIDVVHVHFVEPLHLIYFWGLWKKAKRKILTFWGSDILRASKTKLRMLPFFLKQADNIVFMIPNQYHYFKNIYGNRYMDKVRIIDFGNDIIDEIDKVFEKYSKEECKKHFGLPLDKIIVHIGYNAAKEQQHDLILEEMKALPQDILLNMKLVFHVSYGQGENYDAYKDHLTELLDSAHMDYVFYDDYFKDEELAIFRRTCDLFIYGIQSDSRSASPLEYVYSGALFICPEWLLKNYELLDRAEAKYYKYKDFSELNDMITLCLKKIKENSNETPEKSREIIRNETSWKAVTPKWKALYK